MADKEVPKDPENVETDKATGLKSQQASEKKAKPPREAEGGGMTTTDPSFEGGAQEIDSKPRNLKTP